MNKSKKTTTKIILGMILFLFVISLFGFTFPTQAATETNLSSLYANPNQSSSNTYKFKISDVVSSNLLTNVVGCTGVVNKVSTWMIAFIQSPAKALEMLEEEYEKYKELLKSACSNVKASTEAVAGATPMVNDLVKAADTILEKTKYSGIKVCEEKVEATDSKVIKELYTANKEAKAKEIKEQCFDGIAITLAKNQLTAMTRSAMNWVNTGYGGNSFFVKDMIGLVNNIERNVVETGIDILLSPDGNQNPYARSFAQSTLARRNLVSSATNFYGSLRSDLGSFLTDPKSYYTNEQLDEAGNTRTALQNAQEANDVFSNNFSSGGWDAYLALTQRDQNNPLGFTMQASQFLADQEVKTVAETQSDLDRNNGFLSQKECILWQVYGEDRKPKYPPSIASGIAGNTTRIQSFEPIKSSTQTSEFDQCIDWKVTTPGSIIKDKVTNYLNSPERQLELADTINDSLNALFSILISKLEQGGLSGLSDSVENTSNWEDTTNDYVSADGNTTYDNGGAYNDFNLTRDLGNNYIYDNIVKLGTWNARTCPYVLENQSDCNVATLTNLEYTPKDEENKKIKLYPNAAPEVYQVVKDGDIKLLSDQYGSLVNPTNGYYTVTTAGKTKLISEGYNNWEVGDRAFWNGSSWQNWKCGPLNTKGECTVQANPIKKRGVVQIQNDYIVAAKEILGVLPSVMTNLGKLDYCLPGPNPSYKTNSTDAQSAYQDWVGSIYVGIYDSTGKRYGVKIDKEGDRTYDNLKNIYKDNPNLWEEMLGSIEENRDSDIRNIISSGYTFSDIINNIDNTYIKLILKRISYIVSEFSNICNASRNNCLGEYTYTGSSLSDNEEDIINEKQERKEKVQDYVNNQLFQDFYKTFDTAMNEKYFKNMTNLYKDTEKRIGLDKNPAYVPMAEAGFDLTKNIMYYNDDIEKAKSDYTEAMSQARVNISKLNPIKSEVSGIIQAAQDRRSGELMKKFGLDSVVAVKNKYKTCFEEENIEFYDADDITAMGSANEENCSDGIDNDFNGLIDMKDPNCQNSTPPTLTIKSTLSTTIANFTTISWAAGGAYSCSDENDNEIDTTGSKTETITATNKTFKVTCIGSGGTISKSVTVPLMVAPSQPTHPTVFPGACGSTNLTFKWSPYMPDGTTVMKYEIYRDDVLAGIVNGSAARSFTDTGLIPNTTYSYKVKAINLAGSSESLPVSGTVANVCP